VKPKILTLVAFCLLIACAPIPMRTPNIKNPSEMLPEKVWLEGIKIEKGQAFADCVPVAIEAIFKFYGKNIPRKEIDDAIRKTHGTRMNDAIPYIKEQGFHVYNFYDRTENKKGLKFYLAQGFPIIVSGGAISSRLGHAVVLIGYDDKRKIFYVVDPERRAIIEKRYFDFGEWHNIRGGYGTIIAPQSKEIPKLGEFTGKREQTWWGWEKKQNRCQASVIRFPLQLTDESNV